MAIYGFGARFDEDVTDQFVQRGIACVGWKPEHAPPAHHLLQQVRDGDIVFIKSFTPQSGLTVKAIGIVTDDAIQRLEGLGWAVKVRWLWTGLEQFGKLDDKWPVRSVTLFEEHHPSVRKRLIELLIEQFPNSGAPVGPVERSVSER